MTGVANQPAALEGLVVLDVSHVLAGPYCAMMLADMGATVIKIEPPWGDEVRQTPPFKDGRCAAFDQVNRNKQSICLDFRRPDHVDAFLRMVAQADVVVENLRAGKMDQLGLGYSALSKTNPRLVMGSISGFGQTGPDAGKGGYDLMAQAASGLMSVTGSADGGPLKCGLPVTDLTAALFLTQGILSALMYRQKSNVGQYVETSLFESAVALSVWQASQYFGAGRLGVRHGNGHPLMVPYGSYETRDRPLVVAGHSERFWPIFCKTIGASELLDDERNANAVLRVQRRDEIDAIVQQRLLLLDRESWLQIFASLDIPAAPIQDYGEVYSDPQTLARNMIVDDPGGLPVVGNPVKMSATPWSFRKRAPQLGEDGEAVLRSFGFAENEAEKILSSKKESAACAQ